MRRENGFNACKWKLRNLNVLDLQAKSCLIFLRLFVQLDQSHYWLFKKNSPVWAMWFLKVIFLSWLLKQWDQQHSPIWLLWIFVVQVDPRKNLILSKPGTMEHSSADYMRPLDFHSPLLCMDIFQQVSLTCLCSVVWQYFHLVYSNNIVLSLLKSHPSWICSKIHVTGRGI